MAHLDCAQAMLAHETDISNHTSPLTGPNIEIAARSYFNFKASK
ncbi:MAG: hypothetical protein N2110_06255 [Flavobacteriales bacterium]|nr:hypothetical protein [Flavobacteriales bacterium]